MEKTIMICGTSVPLKSTAASLISYKANFGRDGLKDLLSLANMSGDLTDGFDADFFYRFLWVFAKAADKSIPPLEEWLDQFDTNPIEFITEAFPQVVEMLVGTLGSSVKSKNTVATEVTK